MSELAKPGRDPRQQFEIFAFTDGVSKMEDLKPGLKLPGIVTNVTAFGAFVDIGVHQDGLVHISQLSDSFVKNPSDIVKVQQKVQVTVLEVDLPRKRIALSMKSRPEIGSGSSGSRKNEPNRTNANHPIAAARPSPSNWAAIGLVRRRIRRSKREYKGTRRGARRTGAEVRFSKSVGRKSRRGLRSLPQMS